MKVLHFKDFEHYTSQVKKLRETDFTLRIKKVILIDKIAYSYFKMGSPFSGYYCTDEFKNAIEDSKLNGFNFSLIKTNFD